MSREQSFEAALGFGGGFLFVLPGILGLGIVDDDLGQRENVLRMFYTLSLIHCHDYFHINVFKMIKTR